MATISSLFSTKPLAGFLFTEEGTAIRGRSLDDAKLVARAGANTLTVLKGGIFIFQYWPTQLQDNYDTEWAAKTIPGLSHPLYQWVGGTGRTISFDALFTSEVTDEGVAKTLYIPSSRYTVDVAAAVASLRGLQYPKYPEGSKDGVTEPPPRLRLCFPGTNIGGNTDGILCFLKSAKITYESCFPDGRPRVVTMGLEFIETIQNVASGENSSNIIPIGRSAFEDRAAKYTYTPT